MAPQDTSSNRRLIGRADALVLMWAKENRITQAEMMNMAVKWGLSQADMLRAGDRLTKFRELNVRPFSPKHYDGLQRCTPAKPREGEKWCGRGGHYVKIIGNDGEQNFYDIHLEEKRKGRVRSTAFCKTCYKSYMRMLTDQKRTARSKRATEMNPKELLEKVPD